MTRLARTVGHRLARWSRRPSVRSWLIEVLEPVYMELREKPGVRGPRDRLHIHATAVVNDAFFNTWGGSIHVAEDAFFGHQVMILTGRHAFEKVGAERKGTVPREGFDVVVETGAWIASRALVIGPCTIGAHSVVAAGSVVTESVAPGTMVAGVPARLVRWISPE